MDVAKTASKLSKFSQNPLPIYDAAVIKAIAYLYQTKTLAIEYSNENVKNYIFAKASDATFGNNLVSRKSIKGYHNLCQAHETPPISIVKMSVMLTASSWKIAYY